MTSPPSTKFANKKTPGNRGFFLSLIMRVYCGARGLI